MVVALATSIAKSMIRVFFCDSLARPDIDEDRCDPSKGCLRGPVGVFDLAGGVVEDVVAVGG